MLCSVLTSRQLQDWIEFNRISPIGEGRADYRHAIHMASLAAASGKKNVRVSDYVPVWHKEHNPVTKAAIDRVMSRIKAALKQQ